jgi:hypothetical protein
MTTGTLVRTIAAMDDVSNRARRRDSTAALGTLAMALVPVQQVLVFAFLVIQPDRPLSNADSLYALGTLGWLWRAGAIATGVGVIALAWGLSRSLASGKRVRLAISTMIGGGLAVIGTGVFPTDPPRADGTVGYTIGGVLHFAFGILGLLALLVTVFLLKDVFKRDPEWSDAANPTAWLAWWLLAGVVLLVSLPEDSTAAGVTQRLVFIPEAIWAVWVGWRIRWLGRPTTPSVSGTAASTLHSG